jgi:hypothetical protein
VSIRVPDQLFRKHILPTSYGLARELPYTLDQVLGRGAYAGWLPAEPADFSVPG